MVKLRLKRMGTINKPFYRIIAIDARKKRDGKYLESLGYYDPKTDPLTLKVDVDKSIKWLKVGAQPTDTVRSLFRRAGIMEKWHNLKLEKISENKNSDKPIEKEEKKKTAPQKTKETKVEETKAEKPAKKTVKKAEKKEQTKVTEKVEKKEEVKEEKKES